MFLVNFFSSKELAKLIENNVDYYTVHHDIKYNILF
jgi:hypothetical protein